MTATAPEPLGTSVSELMLLKAAIRELADEYRGYHNEYIANQLEQLITP